MSQSTESSSVHLSATYDSPTGHKDFIHTISIPQAKEDGSVEARQKMKYLSELRASSKKIQEHINIFLTEKMEEDKRAAGQDDQNGASKHKLSDELEEQNYGEEDEEDKT